MTPSIFTLAPARLVGSALAISIAALLSAPKAAAEQLIGLDFNGRLVSFDSATPGMVTTIGPVTGLLGSDILIGIDRRPSTGPNNGLLYALGVNSGAGTARIYTINESTAAATPGFTLAADPTDSVAPTPYTTISGTSFGIDFNPTVDRLRITSNTGQNLRINVDNGLTQLDVPLSYVAGDPNFGKSPVDIAVAYTNSFAGATSTILRGVDVSQGPDALVQHLNANAGTLQTLGNLPFDGEPLYVSYDISGPTGIGYFAVGEEATSDVPFSTLYASGPGGITLVGNIGGSPLLGLAAAVGAPIPEPGTALFGLALCGVLAARRARRSK